MVSEEKLRDSILTKANCRDIHSTKVNPATSGQQGLESGLTRGDGVAVQSSTVRVPAQPLHCRRSTGTRGLASSSLRGVVRIRECRQSPQNSTSQIQSLQKVKPSFLSLLLKSGYCNFIATCKSKCPSKGGNYIHLGTFCTKESHTVVTREDSPDAQHARESYGQMYEHDSI